MWCLLLSVLGESFSLVSVFSRTLPVDHSNAGISSATQAYTKRYDLLPSPAGVWSADSQASSKVQVDKIATSCCLSTLAHPCAAYPKRTEKNSPQYHNVTPNSELLRSRPASQPYFLHTPIKCLKRFIECVSTSDIISGCHCTASTKRSPLISTASTVPSGAVATIFSP